MADTHIRAVITADDRASGVIKGFTGSFGQMAAAVATGTAIFETLKSVTFGVVGVFTDSIEAFEKQELATVRLRTGINNVKTATDKNIDSLLKQATALEKNTRFSDEAIISAQGILTTFQLNQKAISAITPRLLDMSEGLARVTGEMPDLEGNAILVAKAIGGEDVVGLVGALRRVGVVMTQHQTDLLTTGNMQTRLATITEVLDNNFRGMAESAGTTTAGKIAILQNAINNLQEQLGAALADALSPFIAKLTEWAQSDQARATMQQIADKIVEISKQFVAFLKDNWPQIREALTVMGHLALDIAGAIGAIYNAVDFLRRSGVFEALKMVILGPLAPVVATLEYINSLLGRVTVTPAQAKSIIGNINAAVGGPPKFAGGVTNFSGGAAIVGERGPELVTLPRGANVTPNDKLGGSTFNITVQAGAFMGNPSDARAYAKLIMEHMKDIAGTKNMTAAEMLS